MSKGKDLVAYTLNDLPFGITLHVKASANAWWMNQQTLHTLFAAFRYCATILEACAHAGITEKQYKYFQKLHPQMAEIREGFSLLPGLVAKKKIVDSIYAGNLKSCWRILEQAERREARNGRNSILRESIKRRNLVLANDKAHEAGIKAYREAYLKALREKTIKEIQAMPE